MNYEECKEYINSLLKDYLTSIDYDTRLKEGMIYILENGKRLRSIITLSILQQKLENWKDFEKVALIPEFVHTASLIIDDLPAFDNATHRRGNKCIHLVKGEGITYLLSFNLVTESLLILNDNLSKLKDMYGNEAYSIYQNQIMNLVQNISAKKALEGQLLSTFNINEATMTKVELLNLLSKKTSTFFEIAFVLPVFISGNLENIEKVKEVSNLLGICYQIYDDFMDYEEDTRHGNFSHNYVYHLGVFKAYDDFKMYLLQLKNGLMRLGIYNCVFEYIINFIEMTVNERKLNLL
jgi:geranylgeranyl diphosphate synthase, type II